MILYVIYTYIVYYVSNVYIDIRNVYDIVYLICLQYNTIYIYIHLHNLKNIHNNVCMYICIYM